MPTGPVMSGIGVMTSRTSVVAHSATGVKRRSRLVTMPMSFLSSPMTGRPETRYSPQIASSSSRVRSGADRDRVGDHAGLGPLDEVDLVGLVGDREVAVQHPDAALPGHRDRHARLGDGVHRRGDERRPERQLAGEARRGVDVVGGEVAVAREEEDVVVGQPHRGERRRDVRRSEGHCPILREAARGADRVGTRSESLGGVRHDRHGDGRQRHHDRNRGCVHETCDVRWSRSGGGRDAKRRWCLRQLVVGVTRAWVGASAGGTPAGAGFPA